MATLEQIRLLTIRGRTEGLDRVQAELAGISRASFDVARASDEVARATDTSARRQASVASGWSKVTSEMQGSTRATREYVSVMRLAADAEAQGLATAQQSAQVRMFAQSRLQDQAFRGPKVDQSGINSLLGVTDAVASSAPASADAFSTELDRMETIAGQKARQIGSTFQEELNRSLGIGSSAAAGGASFSALEDQMRQLDEIEKARAAHNAIVSQQGMADQFGIGGSSKSARDSAAAFQEAAQEAEQMERQVAALRAQLDPLAAVQGRLNAELQEYRVLAAAGRIEAGELAAAEAMVGARMAAAEKHIGAAGAATKLTSYQMTGLGYQINDVATMLAMGASPFMVISSQAGQVIQVLGEGPGLRGSISAIGTGLMGLVNPTTVVVGGLLAITAGAAAYARFSRESLKPIADVLAEQRRLLGEIGEQYDGLPEKIRRASAATPQDTRVGLALNKEDLEKQLADQMRIFEQTVRNYASSAEDVQMAPDLAFNDQFQPLTKELNAFFAGVADHSKTMRDFRGFLNETFENAPDGSATKEAARQLLELGKAASETEGALRETTGAIDLIGPAMRRAAIQAQGSIDIYRDLAAMLPDLRTEAEQLNDAFTMAMSGAMSPQEAAALQRMKQQAFAGINKDASDTLRDEQNQRALVGLKGEAAGIAEVNQRYDRLIEQYKGADDAIKELNKARAEAIGVVTAEAAVENAEALRDRNRARMDSVAALQAQIGALGMTRGAALALRTEEEQILALRRRAEDTGGVIDPAEEAEIRRTAQALGALTDQMTALNIVRDQQSRLRGLNVQASTIGASDDIQRRAAAIFESQERLAQQGIDANSELGRSITDNDRKLSDYEDSVRRVADAWGETRKAGESAIDSMVDGLSTGEFDISSILDDAKKTLMELAVGNPLKNMLTGSSYGTLVDLITGPGAAPGIAMPTRDTVGLTAASAMWVRSADGAGATGAVAALNDNFKLGGASTGMSGNSVQAQVANYLAGKGMAPHQIAGVMGNVHAESAFNPAADTGDGGNAYGLFQWNDRRHKMVDSVGSDWKTDIQGQMDFFWKEMMTTEKASFDKLMASTDVRGATRAVAGFERPSGYSAANPEGAHNFSGRLSAANDAYAQLGTSSQQLATSATAFTTDFSQVTGQLNAGLGSIVDQAVPGFGGVFTKLLDGLSQAGSGAGGGGGLGGWLGSIFGGSPGLPSVPALAPGYGYGSTLGLFDRGGYTGRGGKYDPAGIVHRDEFVFDQDATRRIGVDTLEAMRRGLPGYANGGHVSGSRLPAGVSIPSDAVPRMQAPANSGSLKVNVINNGEPATAEVRKRDDGQGGVEIEVVLDRMTAKNMATGGTATNKTMRRGMGVSQPLVSR